MEAGKKCMIGGCTNIAIARDLCQTHYKRQQRHGHVLETRPADWGARSKHPLYPCWKHLMRTARQKTAERWHDFWAFVEDLGESRPSEDHLLLRRDGDSLFGPGNTYWREPRISGNSEEAKAKHRVYIKEWNRANPDKLMERELRKKYGIGIAEYTTMFDAQEGRCALCRCEEIRVDHRTKKISRLAVDHCHRTDAIRQLLCHTCNNGLGAFKDDPARLRAAAAYLDRHAYQQSLPARTPAADGSARDYLMLFAGAAGPPN